MTSPVAHLTRLTPARPCISAPSHPTSTAFTHLEPARLTHPQPPSVNSATRLPFATNQGLHVRPPLFSSHLGSWPPSPAPHASTDQVPSPRSCRCPLTCVASAGPADYYRGLHVLLASPLPTSLHTFLPFLPFPPYSPSLPAATGCCWSRMD
ncbi:hypothetical protein B0H16DRAFT_1587615, partial [Mycena metata]